MNNLQIPRLLRPLVADCSLERVTMGDTCARVFRLRRENRPDLFLKCAPFGNGIADEANRLQWLNGRISVPSVVASVTEGEWEFLLTEALPGVDGTEAGRIHPQAVATGLARQLLEWHSQPVSDCPFDETLAVQLEKARVRTHSGLVDEDDFDEERRGRSAIDVLAELESEPARTEAGCSPTAIPVCRISSSTARRAQALSTADGPAWATHTGISPLRPAASNETWERRGFSPFLMATASPKSTKARRPSTACWMNSSDRT